MLDEESTESTQLRVVHYGFELGGVVHGENVGMIERGTKPLPLAQRAVGIHGGKFICPRSLWNRASFRNASGSQVVLR
jgi:hypothetical protein